MPKLSGFLFGSTAAVFWPVLASSARADQGIFSFWIRSWKEKKPLKYIGFDGRGSQVRDCLHPRDLISPPPKNSFKATNPPIQTMGSMCVSATFLEVLRILSRWLN